MFPLTVARAVGALAKTFCLASIDAAFYQIARGLLLPFTLALSLAVLRPRPYFPPLSLAGAAAVMLGFAAGTTADVRSRLTGGRGLLLGIGSSATTAAEAVVVKTFVARGGDGPAAWQLAWMSGAGAVVLLVPLLLVSGEAATLAAILRSLARPADPSAVAAHGPAFLRRALLAGGGGFLLTVATFAQIDVTSPTTHMVVTAVRGVVQSALAVAVLREPVTSGRVVSMLLIIGGSAVYGWGRDRYAHGVGAGTASRETDAPVPRDDSEHEKFYDEERAQRDGRDGRDAKIVG